MNQDLIIVLALLAAAVVMFAINRPRMDAVALLMLTVLPFTGVITMDEALAGFSDSSVVLIAALFVIGEGLVRTGVARKLGDALVARAGGNETRLIVLLMLAVASLGAFMSSTGVVAIFIPVVLRLAQSTGIAPSRLMMPLSVAALSSGMMTLVATAPNLVVNSELMRQGFGGFGFFSFTPFGIPVLIVAVAYMIFARRSLAPTDERAVAGRRPSLDEWIEAYKLGDREHRLRVTDDSPLVGRTLEETISSGPFGVEIIAVDRGRRSLPTLPVMRDLRSLRDLRDLRDDLRGLRDDLRDLGDDLRDLIAPGRRTVLNAGDVLFVDLSAPDVDIEEMRRHYALEALPLAGASFADRSQEIGMAEAMVSADSTLIGKSVVDARFRTQHGLTVIGLRHGGVAVERNLLNETLAVGDTLLLVGPWKALDRLRSESQDLVVLRLASELEDVVAAPGKTARALFCLALVVALMVSGLVPNVQAAFIGCLLMGAFGCVDLDGAYRAIHWKSLVLIVGMLPFSLALQRTGGVELAVEALGALTSGGGTYVVLGSLFLITAVLGLFISNTATAVLMAPVAIGMAGELQASPYPFAMIVALAASAAFMTPVSSPVNTMVVTPGNYTFGDFVRIGVPLAVMVLVLSVILVPLLLPL